MTTEFARASDATVDGNDLRALVRDKYSEVATNPDAVFHFDTGRRAALKLGYPETLIDSVPQTAVEAFAGVANPISAGPIDPGLNVVDVGSGGGFDPLVVAQLVGPTGFVVGVDMTPEMLERSRQAAAEGGFANVEFRKGLAENLPVEDGWADVVTSNGVINLVADKAQALAEINRVLKPGGVLQFGDIANGKPVPESAKSDIDLWAA